MEVQAARAPVRRAPRRLRRATRQLRPAQEGQARAAHPAGEAGGDAAAGAAPARRRECRRRGRRALGRGRHEHEGGGLRTRRRGGQAVLGIRRWWRRRRRRQALPLRRGRRRRGALPSALVAPATARRRRRVHGVGSGRVPPPPPAAVVIPVPLQLAVLVVHGADLQQLPMVGIRVPQRVIDPAANKSVDHTMSKRAACSSQSIRSLRTRTPPTMIQPTAAVVVWCVHSSNPRSVKSSPGSPFHLDHPKFSFPSSSFVCFLLITTLCSRKNPKLIEIDLHMKLATPCIDHVYVCLF